MKSMVNNLPPKEKMDSYVKLGLVERRTHLDLPLSIYAYSILTNYERLWNRVTLNARGLVYDDKGRVIVRCIPKFFNEDEPHATCEIDITDKPVYYDKLDGSLIQIVNDEEYGLVITSKGSFHSAQAVWAREYVEKYYGAKDFKPGYTFAFELIHPENRIVVDYGDEYSLNLIAVIDINTGNELSIHAESFEIFRTVKTIQDIEAHE